MALSEHSVGALEVERDLPVQSQSATDFLALGVGSGGGASDCGGGVQSDCGKHLWRRVDQVHGGHWCAVELVDVQALDVVVGVDEDFVALSRG